MKKYVVCFILMYILMFPDYVLAIMAPSGVDAQGNPVYDEQQVENVVIDNTQRSVRLPPALSNYRMKRIDTNMPEDIQGLDDGGSSAGTGNRPNNTGNNQELPDDMKYLETGSANQSTGSNAVATPVTSSGNTSVSTTGAGVNKTKPDNTFTLLWFIMACLVVALVISVLYMVHTKKSNSSSIENF